MTSAVVVPRVAFQARIVPPSVENRNSAGPEPTTKCVPPLNTTPVGAVGTETTRAAAVPSPMWIVDVLEPLLATHHGDPELAARPQGFTRLASTFAACPD